MRKDTEMKNEEMADEVKTVKKVSRLRKKKEVQPEPAAAAEEDDIVIDEYSEDDAAVSEEAEKKNGLSPEMLTKLVEYGKSHNPVP